MMMMMMGKKGLNNLDIYIYISKGEKKFFCVIWVGFKLLTLGNSGGSEAIVARARTSAAVGVPAGLDAIRATRETRRVQTIFARLRNFIFSKQKHQKRARNGEVGIWFFFFFFYM